MAKAGTGAWSREPGFLLSALIAASLMLSVTLVGGMLAINEVAKKEPSQPAEVEVTTETVAKVEEAAPLPAPAPETAQESPEVAKTPVEAPPAHLETKAPPAVVPSLQEAQAAPAVESVLPSPMPAPEAVNPVASVQLPGNDSLMPTPPPVNRLNPLLSGMPLPARPKPVEAVQPKGVGSPADTDTTVGAAAPELKVTAEAGQGGEGSADAKGSGIVVQALINHLGIVEGVEILRGSADKVGDVMAVEAMKKQRYRLDPPLPPGQKILRTFYLDMSPGALP